MTVNECKKDVARRLKSAGVDCLKLTARTVSFAGFGYGECVFVKIHNPGWTDAVPHLGVFKKNFCADVPKPSDGGYCVETNEGGFA